MKPQYTPKVGDLVTPIFADWPMGVVLTEPFREKHGSELMDDVGTVDVAWFFKDHKKIAKNFCANLVLVSRPEGE